jgi:hypothetical protein
MAKNDKTTRAKGTKADATPGTAGAATPAAGGAKRPGRSTTTATGDDSTAARRGGTRTTRTAKEEGGAVPGGTEGGTTSTRTVRAAGPRAGVSAAAAAGNAPRAGGTNRQDDVRRSSNLRADLRAFVDARPAGWNHDDWIGFLDHLRGRGHDVSDSAGVGMQLERERLTACLEQVPGMGTKRVDTIVDRYHTLYSARHADVDELAGLPGMNRALAERVRQTLG